MLKSRRWVIPFVLLAQGGVSIALAQDQQAQPGPDILPPDARPGLQAQPGAQPEATAPQEGLLTIDDAQRLMLEMDTILQQIEQVHEQARAKNDILRLLCLGEQVKEVRKARQAGGEHLDAYLRVPGDVNASRNLRSAHGASVEIKKRALACVGKEGDEELVVEEEDTSEETGSRGEGTGSESESESESGSGSESGSEGGGDTGSGEGDIPPEPFESLPPVVTSPTR